MEGKRTVLCLLLALALASCQGLGAVSINDAIAGIGKGPVLVVHGESAHPDDEAAAKLLVEGLKAEGVDAMLARDDQVMPWSLQNAHLVVVGGPSVNRFARALRVTKWDFCAERSWPCEHPRAVVRAFVNRVGQGKYAIVVAGWEREQTSLCASLLAAFRENAESLAASAVDVGGSAGAPSVTVLVPASDRRLMLVSPGVLYAGGSGAATITASDPSGPVAGTPVVLVLENATDQSRTVLYHGKTPESGHLLANFHVPQLDAGGYKLIIESGLESLSGDVSVKVGRMLFIETDKPIYKPGQLVHGRVLALDGELKPVSAALEVGILDAKGIKVFKRAGFSDEWGSLAFDLPLATELNLGTWKVTAKSGEAEASVDVRVERYVLPKFKVGLDLAREWLLADEALSGSVKASYFFGKPVAGSAEVKASRYVGVWEEYATYLAQLDADGAVRFELKPVGFAAGTVGAGGAGSVMLNVTVTDTGGHAERESRLLKVVASPVLLQLIAESPTVKPGLAFDVLVTAKTPDGEPVDAAVTLTASFTDEGWSEVGAKTLEVQTMNGMAVATLDVPKGVQRGRVEAASGSASASLDLAAAYSPSSSFLHLAQSTRGTIAVGTRFEAEAHATFPGTTFYDVVAAGRTVFSGVGEGDRIRFAVTPTMAPKAKLVAYRINPDNEVAADTLPFDVELSLPVELGAAFDRKEAAPGDTVTVSFDAGRRSLIGFAIVDESVFALSEGRLNLRQVFDELERRFAEPAAEAHGGGGFEEELMPDFEPRRLMGRRGFGGWGGLQAKGALETLQEAGLVVISSDELLLPTAQQGGMPPGAEFDGGVFAAGGPMLAMERAMAVPAPGMAKMAMSDMAASQEAGAGEPLAEVERVRQFFPETWMWVPDLATDAGGKASMSLAVPDSITNWKLHAVSSSPAGLGIAESELKAFQEFFVDPDLPYSVIRGERFPVKVQVYNYLGVAQRVLVTLDKADWFELVSGSDATVEVEPNGVRAVTYVIRPTKVGTMELAITGRGPNKADAVVKKLIVEPEGTRREAVENGVVEGRRNLTVGVAMPPDLVPDSDKVLVHVTPSLAAQAISGVEDLLGMPYGCGEQTMLNFAPDVEMLRYLKATDQLKPEVRAKAEFFIQTGYQRELTFQRQDGSFSAFGDSDEEGSLWLSDFVLMTFSNARELLSVDESVLDRAAGWLSAHQGEDGSWEPVGFLHHSDMKGGLSGTYGLTAYTALALSAYGRADPGSLERARGYLEEGLPGAKGDPYALAIAGLALRELGSEQAGTAADMLMALAATDERGTRFRPAPTAPGPYKGVPEEDEGPAAEGMFAPPREVPPMDDAYVEPATVAVETASYAAILLMELKRPEAAGVVKWVHSRRNARGGYGSTQDTVMAFKALMLAARAQGRDVDLEVAVLADGREVARLSVGRENFDVLQTVEVPRGAAQVALVGEGSGETSVQVVRIWHEPARTEPSPSRSLDLSVVYLTEGVEVDALVHVNVTVANRGPASTGMLLVDVAVPTGFAADAASLDALAEEGRIMRYELAGRKVILYMSDLRSGSAVGLAFKVRSLFPVKAKIPVSRAYAYYDPAVSAESAAGEVMVEG